MIVFPMTLSCFFFFYRWEARRLRPPVASRSLTLLRAYSHLGAAIVKVRMSIVKERIATFFVTARKLARNGANRGMRSGCLHLSQRMRIFFSFTSWTIDRSTSLGPSTLQTFVAHGTTCVGRLDSILAEYRVDLKNISYHYLRSMAHKNINSKI